MSKKEEPVSKEVFDVDSVKQPYVHICYDAQPQQDSAGIKHLKHPNIWKHIHEIADKLDISYNRAYHMYRLLVDNYTNYDEWSDDIETILLNAYKNKKPGQTLSDAIDGARNKMLDARSMKHIALKGEEEPDIELSLYEAADILTKLIDEARIIVSELKEVIEDVKELQASVESSKSKSSLRKWLHV